MKRRRTRASAGKAPMPSPVATVQIPLPLLAVLADTKTASFGLCLTAGQRRQPGIGFVLSRQRAFAGQSGASTYRC